MNLKKLSIAAALSIGIMSVGSIAKADAPCPTGAACPVGAPCPVVQPQQPVAAPCPVPVAVAPACPPQIVAAPAPAPPHEVIAPITMTPQCAAAPIQGCTPNCAPDARVLDRQVYAYPDIGGSDVVIPMNDDLIQIGGEEEQLVAGTACPNTGLTNIPPHANYGAYANSYANNCCAGGYIGASPTSAFYQNALTLFSDKMIGGAAPLQAAYPNQIMQGIPILRSGNDDHTAVIPAIPCDPCGTGGAAPFFHAVPTIPVAPNPCNPCGPNYIPPMSSSDIENNVVPCSDASEVEKNIVPCDAMEPRPTGAACPPPCPPPCPQPCPSGAAVPVVPVTPVAPAMPVQPVTNPGRAIQTSSGIQIQRSVLKPVTVQVPLPVGAACPVTEQYPDVSNACTQSGCDINKLTMEGVLAGYPDRTYKPNVPIMRDEFASAMVSALELDNVPDFQQQIFRDVPNNHWANKDIDKAYNRGLVSGYPDNSFKPDRAVTRAEALSAMGKVLPDCPADAATLNCFTDANQIPGWAVPSVAKAVSQGITKDLPFGNQILPNQSASRAEVASMLDNLREKLGLAPCPAPAPTGAATQLQPQVECHTIPTMKLKFNDIISARVSRTGDEFVAETIEPLTIDGRFFPAGSKVHGEVREVIRPGLGENGAIRVAFEGITTADGGKDDAVKLPNDILSAVVIKNDEANIFGRIVGWPFTWAGKLTGIAGRTVGTGVIITANAAEGLLNNIGIGNNEIFQGEFVGATRSYATAVGAVGEGALQLGSDVLSGVVGIGKETADELAYVVAGDGERVAQINPDEILSVAFAVK